MEARGHMGFPGKLYFFWSCDDIAGSVGNNIHLICKGVLAEIKIEVFPVATGELIHGLKNV